MQAPPLYVHHQLLPSKTSSNRSWRQVKVSNGFGVRQERLNVTVGVISTFRTPWHAINSCIKMLVSWHGRACSIHILVSILCSILNIARSVPLVMEKMCSSLGSQFCTKSCENYSILSRNCAKYMKIEWNYFLLVLDHFDTQAIKSKVAIVKM